MKAVHTTFFRWLPAVLATFLLLAGFLFAGPVPYSEAQSQPELPEASEDFYLNDAANVVGEATKGAILQTNASLMENYGVQIVVYTVDTLPVTGYAQRVEYLRSLMKSWQVGGTSGRGLILALSISDGDYLAVAGDALKAEFTTASLKSLLDLQMEPDFQIQAYDSGVAKFFLAAAAQTDSYFAAHPELAVPGGDPPASSAVSRPSQKRSSGNGVVLWVCVGAGIVAVVSIAVFFLMGHIQSRRYSRRTVHRRSSIIYPTHSTVTRHESRPTVQIKSRSASGAYRTTQKPARSRSNIDWRQ